MPGFAHRSGLLETPLERVTFVKWQKSINDAWFSSQTAFLHYIAKAPINFPDSLEDTPTMRAIGVFAHFGLIQKVTKCTVLGCKCKPRLMTFRRSDNGNARYAWVCPKGASSHMFQSISGIGVLAPIRVGGWMPFLNFIALLHRNRPLHMACKEVQDAWGNINEKTLRTWRVHFQGGIKVANHALGCACDVLSLD